MTGPRHRKLGAVVAPTAALLLLAAACSAASGPSFEEGVVLGSSTTAPAPTAPATPPSTAPPIATAPASWVPCRKNAGPAGFECATIQVPLDYQHPGATIGLALDRRRASGAKIGSLLANPGGPGESGVDLLSYEVSFMPRVILDHFDVVGFDPRGVARSAPVICGDGRSLDRYFDIDPAPTTEAGLQALIAGARSFTAGCQAMSGAILPYVGTENAARDMDQIRQAVGDAKLTYLGFSYGTLLGATYAELFPDRVRAMVLDGVIDPNVDPVSASIAQSAGFEQELNAFFADCAARMRCPWKPGGDLHAAFDALMARIRAQRLPAYNRRTLGPAEASTGVAAALYDRTSWSYLAAGLTLAAQGNGAVLLALFDGYVQRHADGSYGNLLEAYPAVTCLDQPWSSDPAVLRQAAAAAAKASPSFGAANLYATALTCSLWPLRATGHPHAIRAAGSPPILVVGSTGDPATPYAWAQSVSRQLDHGVLLTRVGDGHTAYRSSACIRAFVDAYLVDLSVPANGVSCPSS